MTAQLEVAYNSLDAATRFARETSASMLREQRRLLLQDRIDEVDREINRAVYELSGLIEEEIRIVEEEVQ